MLQSSQTEIPDWAVPLYHPYRYKVLYGGRSSGKTWQIARALVAQAYAEQLRIICVREHQSALRLSAKPAIDNAISALRLPGFISTKWEIRHQNGSWFSFVGASSSTEEDIKGWEGVHRCWFEEAHRMSLRSRNLIYPTIFRRENSEFWASFNPKNRTDPIYKDFVLGSWGHGSRYVRHINFNHNPWFPPPEEELRAEWEESDPQSYSHEWLGYPDDMDADKQVLPYVVLKQCVKAYKAGLMPDRVQAPVTDMGLDIAEGGRDKCAQVIRVGPTIQFLDMWPGVPGDLSEAANRCHDNSKEWKIDRLYYDASSPIMTDFRRIKPPPEYAIRGELFGGAVKGDEELYEPRNTNGEIFRSRNIQMADAVRLRANRTVKLMKGDKDVDPIDCLFISDELPDLEMYLGNLTQPVRRRSPVTGKWELDKRGGDENAESPDDFDATCLAFARDSEYGLKARGRGI